MTYYDSIALGYNRLHRGEQIKKIKIISSELIIKKTDRLLDVGCGTGFSFDFLECISYGVDPSDKMLKLCTDKNAKLFCAGAENLPFEDNFFDIVISVTAIHNFKDAKKGILEMRRVGKSQFAFSVLKKAKNFEVINEIIISSFSIIKIKEEEKDRIYSFYVI
jgi:ubiquinone/menaquinone biosynthesis C-methylase UbiE